MCISSGSPKYGCAGVPVKKSIRAFVYTPLLHARNSELSATSALTIIIIIIIIKSIYKARSR